MHRGCLRNYLTAISNLIEMSYLSRQAVGDGENDKAKMAGRIGNGIASAC
jgi:hypothetical protein